MTRQPLATVLPVNVKWSVRNTSARSWPFPSWSLPSCLLYATLHGVKVKKDLSSTSEVVLVGTRVSPDIKDQFTQAALKRNRSVAGQLRHMIEAVVASDAGEGRDRAT